MVLAQVRPDQTNRLNALEGGLAYVKTTASLASLKLTPMTFRLPSAAASGSCLAFLQYSSSSSHYIFDDWLVTHIYHGDSAVSRGS